MAGKILHIFVYTVLLLWFAAVTLPFCWVFLNAARSSQEIFENPFGMPWLITGSPYEGVAGVPTPLEAAKENVRRAWVESGFSTYFLNSVYVTALSLMGILSVSAMAAYVLARFRFTGARPIYLFFISGMMIPAQLILIPLFFQFSSISKGLSQVTRFAGYEVQLHDSLTGLILIYIALSLPFTILVLTGFFKSLPGELREAAILDGASETQVFRLIMLPLARPGLVAATIFNFIGIWNEYLFALVFVNSPEKKTLPLGLASVSIQAQYRTDFGLMFAGLAIILIPTLAVYMLLQRQLTRGITMGALKG